MIVRLYDRQDISNPLNGMKFEDVDFLINELRSLRTRSPFFCDLEDQNGHKLLIGLGTPFSCVQHSRIDGESPYLMALGEEPPGVRNDLEFLINDTATPVPSRFALSQDTLEQIIHHFAKTGEPDGRVGWEAI